MTGWDVAFWTLMLFGNLLIWTVDPDTPAARMLLGLFCVLAACGVWGLEAWVW
jgi:hypothetical protein